MPYGAPGLGGLQWVTDPVTGQVTLAPAGPSAPQEGPGLLDPYFLPPAQAVPEVPETVTPAPGPMEAEFLRTERGPGTPGAAPGVSPIAAQRYRIGEQAAALKGESTLADIRGQAAQEGATAEGAALQAYAQGAGRKPTQPFVQDVGTGLVDPYAENAVASPELVQEAQRIRELDQRRLAYQDQARENTRVRWEDWGTRYQQVMDSEVDPARFWKSRSSFQQAMGILGIAAGALVQDKYGKNMALEMINRAIEQDIGAQESNRKAKLMGLESEKERIGEAGKQDELRATDYATERMTRMDALTKAINAKIAQVGADSRAGQNLAKLGADIGVQRLAVADQVLQGMQAEESTNADRAFRASQKEREIQAQIQLERIQQAGQTARTKLEIAAKKKEGPTGPDVETTIRGGEQTGLWLVGPGGERETNIPMGTKPVREEAIKQVNAGQGAIRAMRSLHEELKKNPGFLDKIRSMQLKGESDNAVLATVFQNIKGAATERENDKAQRALMGYVSAIDTIWKSGDPEVQVRRRMDDVVADVNNQIALSTAANVPQGWNIRWDPKLEAPEGEGEQPRGVRLAEKAKRAKELGLGGGEKLAARIPQEKTAAQAGKEAEKVELVNKTYDELRAAIRGGDIQTLDDLAELEGEGWNKEIKPGLSVDIGTIAKDEREILRLRGRLSELGFANELEVIPKGASAPPEKFQKALKLSKEIQAIQARLEAFRGE